MKVSKVLEALSSLDPEDEIIITWFDRRDVESSFFGGGFDAKFKIKDEHWATIATAVETRDTAYEGYYEDFSDSVSNVMSDYKCEQCDTLDYELKNAGDTGENICKGCGEEEDEVY